MACVLAEFVLWELSIVSSLSLYSILVQHECNEHAWLTSECSYCRLIYMLSVLCVRLTIKVKVGIPESFKVGWYPPPKKKLGRVTFMLINVGITPHVLVKSDFCEFIIHSGRLSVSTVLKSCFKTKFIRDMTRGWIEGQF